MSSYLSEPVRRPPATLLEVSRAKVVAMSMEAVSRIQARGAAKLAWLGWPFTYMDSKVRRFTFMRLF